MRVSRSEGDRAGGRTAQFATTTPIRTTFESAARGALGPAGKRGRTRCSPIRNDLASSTWDGTAFSVMVGIGETFVPAFALALGVGGVEAGLLASAPLIVGAALQLAAPRAVARLGSIRAWLVCCAVLQALAFTPLLAGALLGRLSLPALFLTVAVYWGAGLSTGPAWNTLIETLVPPRLRPVFFARRSRFANAAVLAGFLGGGAILAGADRLDVPLLGFAALFGIAALARLVSAGFLARHREPVPPLIRRVPLSGLAARARSGPAGTLLAYMIALQISVFIAAPFFTPYMLGPLRLTYVEYTVLTAAVFGARVAVFPLLGRLAHRFGARFLLRLAGLGVAPLAVLWLVSDALAYLLVLQLLAGVVWGAYELATMLLFFETMPRSERLSLLTFFNVANAVALVCGSLLGGALLGVLGESPNAYAALFAISSALRFASAFLLLRLPARRVSVRPVATRTVAVRPGIGAIQRPVLSSARRQARA